VSAGSFIVSSLMPLQKGRVTLCCCVWGKIYTIFYDDGQVADCVSNFLLLNFTNFTHVRIGNMNCHQRLPKQGAAT
jgi:hypothetical protein